MSTDAIPLCSHIKANGVLCASPALRGLAFCYFHERWRRTRPHPRRLAQVVIDLPLLEDANAIQVALQRVMQAIVEDRLDTKSAGLLLYALQTASSNLKSVRFEHAKLEAQWSEGEAVEYVDDVYSEEDFNTDEPEDAPEDAVEAAQDIAEASATVAITSESVASAQAPGSTPVTSESPAPVVVVPGDVSEQLDRIPEPPPKPPEPDYDENFYEEKLVKALRQISDLPKN